MQNNNNSIQNGDGTDGTEYTESSPEQNPEATEVPDAMNTDETAAQDDTAAGIDADADDAADDEEYEDDPDFRAVLEALIFASDEPLTFRQIKDIVAPETAAAAEEDEDAPGKRRRKKKSFTITRVKRAIDVLNEEYDAQARSFRIVEVAGGFAFQTTKDFGNWVGKLFAERSRRRLTQSALETLSIIAFRQPISKPAVEGIRGVNAEYVVKSLLERNLISIVGREDSPGRPLLYGTTKTFLKHFGLSSINDLPKPREIKDLLSSEEELGSNPIEEMDPMKAAELTRVSSQELERLFDTAQLREESPDDDDAAGETPADTDENMVHTGPAPREDDDTPANAPPVLHVQFDGGGEQAGAAPDADDDNETDDSAEETDVSAAMDEAPVENPFDAEEPDENERA